MSTFIHGIGASENIDSSGERIIIAGLDISSLDKDGVFNWEHKADQPSQIVGKILKAKKIFSDKDCEDDHQKYFWDKCRVPYLYVMGELFDDYKDSAREVAGLFRYDADKKGQNEHAVGNFSVEGAKIHKEGMDVTRSIARKITITALPCNKSAVAEMVAVDPGKPNKKSIDSLFKTESIEIEVLQVSEKSNLWDLLKKEALKVKAAIVAPKIKKDEQAMTSGPATSGALGGSSPTSPSLSLSEPDMAKAANLKIAAKPNPLGSQIGTTSSGKGVHSHARVGETGFNAAEHAEAASFHQKAAAANPAMAQHHTGKAKLHNSAAITLKDRAIKRAAASKLAPPTNGPTSTGPSTSTLHDPRLSGKITYKKSEVLAPGMKSNATAANQKQERDRRAEEAYPDSNKQRFDKHKVNHSSSKTSDEKEGRASIPNKQVLDPTPAGGAANNNMLHNKLLAPRQTLHKALTAGSSLASPDALTDGAALGKESLEKDFANPANQKRNDKVNKLQRQVDAGTYKPDASKIAGGMLNHPTKPLKGTKVQKSEAYSRAETEYASWEKREEFETFMKSRMPHMTKSEIKAFGQAMILNKSVRMEKSLNGLLGLLKEPKK